MSVPRPKQRKGSFPRCYCCQHCQSTALQTQCCSFSESSPLPSYSNQQKHGTEHSQIKFPLAGLFGESQAAVEARAEVLPPWHPASESQPFSWVSILNLHSLLAHAAVFPKKSHFPAACIGLALAAAAHRQGELWYPASAHHGDTQQLSCFQLTRAHFQHNCQ